MDRPVYWLLALWENDTTSAFLFPTREARDSFLEQNEIILSYRVFEYFVDDNYYWIDERYFTEADFIL